MADQGAEKSPIGNEGEAEATERDHSEKKKKKKKKKKKRERERDEDGSSRHVSNLMSNVFFSSSSSLANR